MFLVLFFWRLLGQNDSGPKFGVRFSGESITEG